MQKFYRVLVTQALVLLLGAASPGAVSADSNVASPKGRQTANRSVDKALGSPTPTAEAPENETGPRLAPRTYVAPCIEPRNKERCELEAQWVSAKAGRYAADLGFWQLLVGIAGLAGLAANLIYVHRSTKIALDATKGADDALKIAERTSLAAVESAAAMVAANQLSERSFAISERPWVSVREVNVLSNLTVAENYVSVEIELLLHNAGKSPAKDVSIAYDFTINEFWQNTLQDHLDLRDRRMDIEQHGTVLFPGQTMSRNIEFMVRQSQLDMKKPPAKKEESAFPFNPAIFGYVMYRSFTDETVRRSGFASRLLFNDGVLILSQPLQPMGYPAELMSFRNLQVGWHAD